MLRISLTCALCAILFSSVAFCANTTESNRRERAGQVTEHLQDSVVVATTGSDTSRTIWIGALDHLALFVRYDNREDSINAIVYMDIAPTTQGEKSKFGTHFTVWDSLNSAIVSGAGDSTAFIEVTSPPVWARYGRLRVVGRMPAGDTTKVTTKLIKTYLQQ